jgi:hypothetical protein
MSIVSELGGIPGKQTISELVAGFGKQKKYILGPGPVEGEEETIDDTEVYGAPLNLIFDKAPGTAEKLLMSEIPYILEFDGNAFEINSKDDLEAFVVTSGAEISEYDFSTHPFAIYPNSDVVLWILVSDNNPHTFGVYRMESSSGGKGNVVVVEVEEDYESQKASFKNYTFDEVYSMMDADKENNKEAPPIVLFRIGSKYNWGNIAAFSNSSSTSSGRKYIHVVDINITTVGLNLADFVFSSDGTDDEIRLNSIPFEQVETGDGL